MYYTEGWVKDWTNQLHISVQLGCESPKKNLSALTLIKCPTTAKQMKIKLSTEKNNVP